VRIDEARLAVYADRLPSKPPGNVLDVTHSFRRPAEDTASYILASTASISAPATARHLVGEGWQMVGGSLYFTLSTRLKNITSGAAAVARRSAKSSRAQVAAMLGLDISKTVSAEFAGICADNLQRWRAWSAIPMTAISWPDRGFARQRGPRGRNAGVRCPLSATYIPKKAGRSRSSSARRSPPPTCTSPSRASADIVLRHRAHHHVSRQRRAARAAHRTACCNTRPNWRRASRGRGDRLGGEEEIEIAPAPRRRSS